MTTPTAGEVLTVSDVKRFDCTNGGAQFCDGCYTMTQDDEYGDYVLYEDYAALRARLAAAESRLQEYEDAPTVAFYDAADDECWPSNTPSAITEGWSQLIIRPARKEGV